MSELDKIPESDHETGGTQAPQASHSRDPIVNTDLVDTFQLFKTARSSRSYSRIVFQPAGDLSAILISLFLLLSLKQG
jgi:hypothetical protein